MIPAEPFLVALLACLAALGCITAWSALRRVAGRLSRHTFAALCILAAVCIAKAQKGDTGPTFAVDPTYLVDDGCYATNDTVHAALRSRIPELYIDDCDVLAYMRERSSTNAADWVAMPTYAFGAYPADFAVLNATNYNYMFILDYVPPVPVHTNGVYNLYGFPIYITNDVFSAGFRGTSAKGE